MALPQIEFGRDVRRRSLPRRSADSGPDFGGVLRQLVQLKQLGELGGQPDEPNDTAATNLELMNQLAGRTHRPAGTAGSEVGLPSPEPVRSPIFDAFGVGS